MEISKYNVDFDLDNKYAIYNLASRNFIICNKNNKQTVLDLLGKLNDLENSSLKDAEKNIIKKLAKQGIIVNNTKDEIEKIKYLFNKTKYQEGTFVLVISPTIECNFGCPYCFEERRHETWDEKLRENLLRFVDEISKKVKILQVSWFGGEPTLEYENIKAMTKKFKDICERNKCEYCSTITTNGYLLNDERIAELEELAINKVQITIDGDEEYHNKKRPLRNGGNTFNKIFENILKISKKDIMLILRINIDENNANSIIPLLERIPNECRSNIIINICNIFQNKKIIKIYELYKKAIELGFVYPPFRKDYTICEGSFVNSMTINPDGKLSPCQMCKERGLDFGTLTDNGSFLIKNPTALYKFRNASPFNNNMCTECKYISVCLGGCQHARYENENVCDGKKLFEQISVEEMAKLAIYNEFQNGCISEYNII